MPAPALFRRLSTPLWALITSVLLVLAGPARAADCPAPLAEPTREQVDQLVQTARDRGVLWRLTKDGRTSWLYGTLHVGRLAWMFPGPRLAQAVRESDTIALEIDLANPAVLQDFIGGLQP